MLLTIYSGLAVWRGKRSCRLEDSNLAVDVKTGFPDPLSARHLRAVATGQRRTPDTPTERRLTAEPQDAKQAGSASEYLSVSVLTSLSQEEVHAHFHQPCYRGAGLMASGNPGNERRLRLCDDAVADADGLSGHQRRKGPARPRITEERLCQNGKAVRPFQGVTWHGMAASRGGRLAENLAAVDRLGSVR